MTYEMVRKTHLRFLEKKYLNTIVQGYRDCKLDIKFLKNALKR